MAKTTERDIERLVTKAYGDLIDWADGSKGLGQIAMQPNGTQERTIQDQFKGFLDKRKRRGGSVSYDDGQNPKYDIVLRYDSEIVTVVEIKAPFTNHDGIRFVTRKNDKMGNPQR